MSHFSVMVKGTSQVFAAALRRSLTQRYAELASPFRTAERFGIEEIADPRQTRTIVCEWVTDACRLLPETLGRKGKSYRP